MTDDTGMLQHAIFSIRGTTRLLPGRQRARAAAHGPPRRRGSDDPAVVRAFGLRYLAFVSHAFDRATGRFRNFLSCAAMAGAMRVGGQPWASAVGARPIIGRAAIRAVRVLLAIYSAALPAVSGFTSPRAWAYALLGIDEY